MCLPLCWWDDYLPIFTWEHSSWNNIRVFISQYDVHELLPMSWCDWGSFSLKCDLNFHVSLRSAIEFVYYSYIHTKNMIITSKFDSCDRKTIRTPCFKNGTEWESSRFTLFLSSLLRGKRKLVTSCFSFCLRSYIHIALAHKRLWLYPLLFQTKTSL